MPGKIPGAYRLSERIIVVPDEHDTVDNKHAALYVRVSSHDQKQDLKRQAQRLEEFAIARGYEVIDVVEEIASGMNAHRKKLTSLLQRDDISTIIVKNKDCLARMNAELIIAASDKDIIIANHTEPSENDVQDVVDFLTSFCARIYGKRSAKNKAKQKS